MQEMSVVSGGETSRKLNELRVVDLRNQLESRGADKTGVKAQLVERLTNIGKQLTENIKHIFHKYCGILKTEGQDPAEYLFTVADTGTPKRGKQQRSDGEGQDTGEEGEDEHMDTTDQGEKQEESNTAETVVPDNTEVSTETPTAQSTPQSGETQLLMDLHVQESEDLDYGEEEVSGDGATGGEAEGEGGESVAGKEKIPEPDQVEPRCPFTIEDTIKLHAAAHPGEMSAGRNGGSASLVSNSDNLSMVVHPPNEDDVNSMVGTTERDDSVNNSHLTEEEKAESGTVHTTAADAATGVANGADKKQPLKSPVSSDAVMETVSSIGSPTATETDKEKGQTADKDKKSTSDKTSGGGKKDEKKSSSKQGDGKGLFVTGLATSVRAADIKNVFSKHGHVTGAKIMSSSKGGVKHFGYVTMSTAEEATKCIQQLHRTDLKGKMISVEKVKSLEVAMKRLGQNSSGKRTATDRHRGGTLKHKSGDSKTPGGSDEKKGEASKKDGEVEKKEGEGGKEKDKEGKRDSKSRDKRGSGRPRYYNDDDRPRRPSRPLRATEPARSRGPLNRRIAPADGGRGGRRFPPPPHRGLPARQMSQRRLDLPPPAVDVAFGAWRPGSFRPGDLDRRELLEQMRLKELEHHRKEEELKLQRERERIKFEREKLEREKLELQQLRLTQQAVQLQNYVGSAGFGGVGGQDSRGRSSQSASLPFPSYPLPSIDLRGGQHRQTEPDTSRRHPYPPSRSVANSRPRSRSRERDRSRHDHRGREEETRVRDNRNRRPEPRVVEYGHRPAQPESIPPGRGGDRFRGRIAGGGREGGRREASPSRRQRNDRGPPPTQPWQMPSNGRHSAATNSRPVGGGAGAGYFTGSSRSTLPGNLAGSSQNWLPPSQNAGGGQQFTAAVAVAPGTWARPNTGTLQAPGTEAMWPPQSATQLLQGAGVGDSTHRHYDDPAAANRFDAYKYPMGGRRY